MPLLNQNNPLNKPIALSNLVWIILLLILLSGNIFFCIKYSTYAKELQQTKANLESKEINTKILEFNKFFINNVLKAELEVDFEIDLELKQKLI